LNAYAALDRAGNGAPILISALRNQVLLISSVRAALVYSIQTSGIQGAHSTKYCDGDRPQPEENVMKNAVFALFLVPLLTMPAFAASSKVGDKPIVVAEDVDVSIGGVGVGVGERHRHRDHTGLYMSERGHHHLHHDGDHR
jgi:hypothetical protein